MENWQSVITEWAAAGRQRWVFEALPYLPPECWPTALAHLPNDCHPSAPAQAALQRVRGGAALLPELEVWGRPPWQRLLQGGHLEVLAQALDGPWNSQVAPLLDGLEPERVRALTAGPGLRDWLTRAGQGPDWKQQLRLWLEGGREDWERMAEPGDELEETLLFIAQHAPEWRPLVSEVVAGSAAALAQLATLCDEPSLGRGQSLDEEAEWWPELLQLPLQESSARLRQRVAQGWLPRRRWRLFAQLRELVSAGDLRLPQSNWQPFAEEALHWCRFSQSGQRVLACARDGALLVYPLEGGKPLLRLHLAREMRWGKVWEVGSCILAYDGYTVGVYELDSKCRWQQDCGDAAIAFGGGRVALLSRGSLRLLRWEDGQEILTRANPQAPPPVQQGPLYMLVDTTAQQLAWSDDGRWLASSHRQNVILWDAETCRPVHTWEHQASVSWLGFRGQRLAVSLSDTLGSTILMGLSKTFFVYHPDSRETLYKADGLRAVNRVEHAADWVGLGCSEQIFWLSIGDPIQARGPIKRHEISLTSLAAGMLACHSLGDNLEIIDLQNAQTVATWQGLTHCQLAPDGTWALALSHGKLRRCQLWDQRPVCELTDLSSAGPRARAYVEALQG